jgi:hypothetical protein
MVFRITEKIFAPWFGVTPALTAQVLFFLIPAHHKRLGYLTLATKNVSRLKIIVLQHKITFNRVSLSHIEYSTDSSDTWKSGSVVWDDQYILFIKHPVFTELITMIKMTHYSFNQTALWILFFDKLLGSLRILLQETSPSLCKGLTSICLIALVTGLLQKIFRVRPTMVIRS